MESIYYVICWACHRRCEHCYEDRFRPYYGAELESVVGQAEAAARLIVKALPERLIYKERGSDLQVKTGRVILAGGEVLLDEVRKRVLYPTIDELQKRYASEVHIVVQTTGDLLRPQLIGELLERGVWMISVSGMDEYHTGIDVAASEGRLTEWFESAGMRRGEGSSQESGPFYHFFGATPGSWIGRLWPRGRAWSNGLSEADLTDNFCNRWSGGLGFLDYEYAGSEVSIDPEGNVYPCCLKTRQPVGNLLKEPLEDMLKRLRGHPVYEAISMGQPERMGLRYGWTVEQFMEKSSTIAPNGKEYRNLCIGCDRFHDEVLANELIQIGS